MSRSFDFNSLESAYAEGLEALHLDNPPAFDRIRAYLELLHQWNASYNLTAIRDPRAMLAEHVLASLAVIPYLQGQRCLDIGSGAGIPGLILALARPGTQWTLVDSNGKKTRFLEQARMALKPGNVEIHQQRIEEFAAGRVFSTIICRAWTALPGFYQRGAELLAEEGVLLAMKPGKPLEELNEVSRLCGSVKYHALSIPGLKQQRGLVVMQADRNQPNRIQD